MLLKIAALTLLGASVAPSTAASEQGPSFDCAKARPPLETLICGNPRLSAQDKLMADLYRAHLAAANDEAEKARRVTEQREWNRNRGKHCDLLAEGPNQSHRTQTNCLSDLYGSRIAFLHSSLHQDDDELRKQARALLPDAPDQADERLSTQLGTGARLDRLLYLSAFHAPSSERDDLIKDIQANLNKISYLSLGEFALEVLRPPPDELGTESLIWTLRATGVAGIREYYAIPCPVLRRMPSLLEATSSMFGSRLDGRMPVSGCSDSDFAAYPEAEVMHFVRVATVADGRYLANIEGSMATARHISQAYQVEKLKLNPYKSNEFYSRPPEYIAYETWSYLSLNNRAEFSRISSAYNDALAGLIEYYIREGWFPDRETATRSASYGLFQAVFGADCGGAPPAISLRRLILDGAEWNDVQSFLAGDAWKDPNTVQPFRSCAYHADIDPLIHIAVTRPDLLDALFDVASSVDKSHRRDLDLIMEPEAVNSFGKTPLMSAAQWDSLGGVEWLLARGVDVNARTGDGDHWFGPRHGHRTALMYAAANASLPMIQRLLEAGADKTALDSRGLSAFDYLTGKGPVPKNPKLDNAAFAEAERLLR